MTIARAAGVAMALGLLATACKRGASGTGATASAATPSPGDASGADAGDAAQSRPRPPVLRFLKPAHPGLVLTWREPTPCDTVEGEREDALEPYPSESRRPVPAPPLRDVATFSVPGGTMSYLDASATMNHPYTFHARCRVAGVLSGWSNELAANPTP
jgi:hypothetical protein